MTINFQKEGFKYLNIKLFMPGVLGEFFYKLWYWGPSITFHMLNVNICNFKIDKNII